MQFLMGGTLYDGESKLVYVLDSPGRFEKASAKQNAYEGCSAGYTRPGPSASTGLQEYCFSGMTPAPSGSVWPYLYCWS